MHSVLRSGLVLAFLACGVWTLDAEEPPGELQLIAPHARAIFANDGQPRGLGNGNGNLLALTPDGKTLIAANNNALNVWDLTVRQAQPRSLDVPNGIFQNGVPSVSPDGKTLVVGTQGGGGDLAVYFFDLRTGKQLREIDNDQPLFGLAYSPDGKLLATGGGDYPVRLWEVATGKQCYILSGHCSPIRALTFSPDGNTLASAGGDIRLWEPSSGRPLRQLLAHPDDVLALAFSGDGRVLASAGAGGTVNLWETATGAVRHSFRGHRGDVLCLAFSPDYTHLASAGKDTTVLVWTVLGGIARAAGADANISAQEQSALWTNLAGETRQAYRAMCRLTAASAQAVSLLRTRLHPVAARVDGPTLARLIADLDSEVFATREKATRELETLGELAIPALRRVQSSRPSLEVRKRVEELLAKWEVKRPSMAERLRTLRAIEVLQSVGTSEARQFLTVLSHGAPEAQLTREAKAALQRLARPSVPQP